MERALTFRAASEADHARILAVFEDWWDERPRPRLERLWFRHWGSTSFVAEAGTGRPVALLIGFVSQDHPAEAVVRLLAVAAHARRRGVGRALVETFAAVASERGATRVVTWVKPGDPGPIAFLRALGFVAVTMAETRPLYGVPAVPDAGGPGEDLAPFQRVIGVDQAGALSSA